ncbi:MAG TPA: ParA family protein [Kiloniellales bacterium]|nr:ParA family protein [Kiloniellales bacterium]
MSGRVVVMASIKGGVGKSTLAASLAVHWLQAGRRVALLDTDPNATLTRWHGKASALAAATMRTELDEHSVLAHIEDLRQEHDVVIVDCAGFGNQAMVFAIGGADLVLIPVMADEASVYEAMRTRKVVESAAAMARRTIPAYTVLTRVKRTSVARHTRAQLEALGANPLQGQLGDRTIFQESSFHGSAPADLAPSSLAAQEVRALAQELAELRPQPSSGSLEDG